MRIRMMTILTSSPHQGKLSSLPATFQALGVLLSYAVGLALNWHQLAWCSYRIIIIPILIITITFIVVYYFKSKKQSNWACIVLVYHHSNRNDDQDMHSSSHFVDLRSVLFARVSLTPHQVQIINDNIDDHDWSWVHTWTIRRTGNVNHKDDDCVIERMQHWPYEAWTGAGIGTFLFW